MNKISIVVNLFDLKISRKWIVSCASLLFIFLAGMVLKSTEVFAGKNESAASMAIEEEKSVAAPSTINLSEDSVNLIGEYLEVPSEFVGLTRACGVKVNGNNKKATRSIVIMGQLRKRQEEAQEEIKKLVGEVKWVERGSMIAGPSEGEYRFGNELPPRLVKIETRFRMPVDDVTVGNYNYLMGLPIDPASKKPMRGLTVEQWRHYVALLNGKMADLWQVAYPGSKVPEFKIPGEQEKDYLEYAASIPIEPRQVRDPQTGKFVTVTAMHSVYPGMNRSIRWGTPHEQADLIELRRRVVFAEAWGAGPADVDSTFSNERGFRNLTGNIWKLIDVPYNPDQTGPNAPRLVVGGDWGDSAEDVQVSSRCDVEVDGADPYVGLRLVSY